MTQDAPDHRGLVDQTGQRDRHVMLSPTLLATLRDWWRAERPRPWFFPGDHPGQPITSHAVREACQRALRRSTAA